MSIEDEFYKYKHLFIDRKTGELPVLTFWALNSLNFPLLSVVARFILSVPATNNATERFFNLSRFTMSKNRSSLDLIRFNQLLVIKSNYDLCDELRHFSDILQSIDETDHRLPMSTRMKR